MGNENVSKSKRGGKREGAGRKSRAGIHSVACVYLHQWRNLYRHSLIFIRTGFVKKETNSLHTQTNETQRALFRQTVSGIVEFERERLVKRNKEDSDRRQLRLFGKRNEIRIANFKKRRFFHTRSGLSKLCRKCCSCLSETGLFIKV